MNPFHNVQEHAAKVTVSGQRSALSPGPEFTSLSSPTNQSPVMERSGSARYEQQQEHVALGSRERWSRSSPLAGPLSEVSLNIYLSHLRASHRA